MMTPPGPVLAGTRVLVTAQRRAGDLASALQRRGAEVTIAAALGVESHIDEETLVARTRELVVDPPDVVVVTTAIGFRSWLETAEAAGLRDALHATLESSRIVARGPKARGAIQAAGLAADWVAESETSRELTAFLVAEGVEGLRVAVQHHGAGDDGVESALTAAGAVTVSLVVYRWGPPPDPEALRQSVQDTAAGLFDAVLFTSAPAAASWIAELRAAGVAGAVAQLAAAGRLLVAAVGPVTADPLIAAGFEPRIPDRGRLGALVRTVVLHYGAEEDGIDVAGGCLRVRATAATLDDEVLPLSPSAVATLRLLASEPGAVFSREQVLQVLPGASTDPHAAEVAVARLREALGGRRVVKTVVKRGYRLDLVDPEDHP